MNKYKLFISSDLTKVKEYSHKFEDFVAATHEQAIDSAKAKYGDCFTVELSSIM